MKLKFKCLIVFTTFAYLNLLNTNLNSQNLPSKKQISQDGRMLISGNAENEGFYAPNEIKSLYLYFDQSNYWSLLSNNYKSETLLPATLKYEGITLENVGVRFRGNTSYQGTGTSQKKSFSIETDFMIEDQNLLGYKNLKLNNSHQDPSFMREVLYSRLGVKYTPMAKTNYVHLFINDQDWGIYPNIQSIDKTFLKEWFLSNDGARFRATSEVNTMGGGMSPGGGAQWGDGTAGMNYLGEDTALYQKYYSLKSTDIDSSWQKLIYATKKLNEITDANYNSIEDVIDVDKTLWFMAVENVFTDDDSYIMKGKMDYMIYYEPETGLTTPIEYDGNSAMGLKTATSTEWTPFKNVTNVKYPLLNKLLLRKEYRSRYLAHYRTILNETFTEDKINQIIDETKSLISDLVAKDTKKLNTTNEFNTSANGLKTFVKNRRAFLISNTEVAGIAPKINSANHFTSNGQELTNPNHNDIVTIKANISSDLPISNVYLYYSTGLVGKFTKVEMFDDGVHNDNSANDSFFAANIPAFNAGTFVRYYVEAGAINPNNNNIDVSYLPTGAEHDVFIYTVNKLENANGIVINEFMAQNTSTAQDEAGDYDDWIELYNNNNSEVDLSGYFLSDKLINPTKWTIPSGTKIPANGYLIIWADEEQEEGSLHTNFKISSATEVLTLIAPNFETVDEVNFGTQKNDISYARNPNGTGDFTFQAATFGTTNGGVSVEDENLTKFNISYYPNPANDFIQINIANLNLLGFSNFELNVYDNLGQIILTKNIESNIVTLDVSNLSIGIYFINIGGNTFKFIKN